MTSTTVSIYYSLKDLVQQNEWDSIEEEFSCPICCELIYKQEWYQCINGHPSCGNCWNKVISDSGSKKCPTCSTPVGSLTDGLSRCRFIEQSFANKKVSCPYSFKENIKDKKKNKSLICDIENGCKEIITIEQLDNHQMNCNSRLVKCNNKGCTKISRYSQHQQQHQNECSHAIIECELCGVKIKKSSLSNHQRWCPSKTIVCIQCPFELKRSDIAHHIDNDCPNSIIQCRFQQYGCNIQFKRSELSSHLKQISHTEIMIKLIDEQSQQLNQQSNKLNHQSQQLNQQSQLLNQQSDKLNHQSQQLNQQSQLLNQQTDKLNHQFQQLDQQTYKLNQQSQQLESYKKDLESSNNKCNDVLDKFNLLNFRLKKLEDHNNTWTTSNFDTKVGKYDSVFSSVFNPRKSKSKSSD